MLWTCLEEGSVAAALRGARRSVYDLAGVFAADVRGAWGDNESSGAVSLTACYLGVCLFAAVVAISASAISGRGVTVAGGVHVNMVFVFTVLRISLVTSVTCL